MAFPVDAHRRGALRQVGAVLGERATDAVRRAATSLRILPADETDAHARGWQGTERGLARVYRDPRFDRRTAVRDEDDDVSR